MTNKSKYLIIIGLVVVFMGLGAVLNPLDSLSARDEASGRIAFVDVQTVFNMHPEKIRAEKDLNAEAQAMQAELESKAKDLSKDEQQEMLKEYQSKLSQKEQNLIQSILVKIDHAIKTVAEQKQVRLVLDKKNVIYGGYDMTQDVIDYIKENLETDNTTEQTDLNSETDTTDNNQ